ncbi:MAG: LysR substrate-binding domain-containing protein, partial [Pseudomonadota bacterium]
VEEAQAEWTKGAMVAAADRRAVEAGLGIADLPDYMAGAVPNLRKVLPDHRGPEFDLYFVYPSDLKRSKRVSAFRDFLTKEIEAFRIANK